MSDVQPKDGGSCILCFWAQRACKGKGKLCCSGARPNQLLIDPASCIGRDVESSVIADLRCRSTAQINRIAPLMNSGYILKFQTTLGLDFELRSPNDFTNDEFIDQIDKMVETWALKIRAKDEALKSISLACRAIGYCNLLIFVKLQNKSDPPLHELDLSSTFAYFAIMAIKNLVANVMSSVRSVQYELDPETRSFMVIWYRYSLIMRTLLPKLGRCELFDNSELYELVKRFLGSFREEQKIRLATDTKNNKNGVNWAVAFDDSRRGLGRMFKDLKNRIMKPQTLSFMVMPYNNDRLSYYTSQSDNSGNAPGLRVPCDFLQMSPSQQSTTAAFPNSAFSANSDTVLEWNHFVEGNRGSDYDCFSTGPSAGADVNDFGVSEMAGYGFSFHHPSNCALERNSSARSDFNLKRDFATFNETSGHHSESTYSIFMNDTWPPLLLNYHNEPTQVYDTNNQSQNLASVDGQIDYGLKKTSTSSSIPTTWPETSPLAFPGFASNLQPIDSANLNNPVDSDFAQAFDFDTCTDRDDLFPGDPQHDHSGDYDTFSRH